MSDEGEKRIWVLGSGEAGRRLSFVRQFRNRSISAIGPSGNPDEDASISPGKATTIRCFRDEANAGDAVILRNGVKRIFDVGRLGEYDHQPDLGITGWDLGHVRSTKWLGLEPSESEVEELIGGGQFRRDAFFPLNRSKHGDLETWVLGLVENVEKPEKPRKPTDIIEAEQVARNAEKIASIESPDRLGRIIEEAAGFGQGEDDYERLEADTVAMVLVPLLEALGARREQIRVEVPLKVLAGRKTTGKRVDLAVLGTGNEPIFIVEAKRRWAGLDWGTSQLDEYRDEIEAERGESVPSMITDGAEFILRDLPEPGGELEFSLRWRNEDTAQGLGELAKHLTSN